ncbi:hypothetical protein [Microbacterium hominis]|uniref:Uncharacterized protein n=1 Tax=Microbacterium hominis TaxID=162426 RepID=A0A7D4PLK5_9MICO|nr:hypothetical protein [Microbacterium hominis]QKJ18935.1 hypothetical protein HQM25_05765 [Microbacterium hominis]
MLDHVAVADVPLPIPSRRLNAEAGLRAFPLAGAECVVGWVEGRQSYRAGVLDASDGSLRGAAPIRGALAGHLADDRFVWMLTDYGLQEVDRETFSVLRTLRAGLPKYASRLLAVGPHHALVVVKYGQSHSLVNLQTMTITHRIRVPEPAVALPADEETVLLSLRYGIRARLAADFGKIIRRDAVPRGTGASVDGVRAIYVTGVPEEPSALVREVGLDPERYVDLAPTGTLAWLGADGLAAVASVDAGVSCVHGVCTSGEIVASDGDPNSGISRLVVLDADGQTPTAAHEFREKAGMLAALPESAVLATPRLFGDARGGFELLRWSGSGAASA